MLISVDKNSLIHFQGTGLPYPERFLKYGLKIMKKKSEIVAFFASSTEFFPLVMYSGVVTEAEPFQNVEISGSCAKPLMNSNLYSMIRH